MDVIKLKVPHVGTFRCKSFSELESLINDDDSSLRIKFLGVKR
jgi:hypothetical protein